MSTAPAARTFESVADLLEHCGNVSPERVRMRPTPGTATEQDVIDAEEREGKLCELIDGILVEKVMGFSESFLAMFLGRLLGNFADRADLGIVVGGDGAVRLLPGLVRIPDVSFVSWDRLPGRFVPRTPIPDLVPDLAVEVLSPSNTAAEMERKLKDYFFAGVRLVWYVDPEKRRVEVFTAPDQSSRLEEASILDGGAVLPDFSVPVRELFARLEAKAG